MSMLAKYWLVPMKSLPYSSLNASTNDVRGCFYSLKFNTNQVGVPVDIKYFNTGSRDILAFATSQGLITGIDIRSPTPVFRFKNDLHHRNS